MEDLADVLDRARDAIGERIERAEAPEEEEATSVWAPAPEPVEPGPVHEEAARESHTEVAPVPAPRSGPPRTPDEQLAGSRNWWDRNRRFVAIGVLVFCLGSAIGAAATGGGDDAKTVKRAANNGKGASQKVETEVSTVTETQSVAGATAQKSPGSSATTTAESSSGASATSPSPASPAAPSTPRVAKCDPGYAPQCLDPSISDYDCQGEGDGPYYVQGPVTVIGNDRFGLDTSDHDGVGCE